MIRCLDAYNFVTYQDHNELISRGQLADYFCFSSQAARRVHGTFSSETYFSCQKATYSL